MDVDNLSDAELRTKLLEFGFPVMPITGTTRKVMAKKLKMLLENKNKIGSERGRRSMGRYSSEEDSDTDLKLTKKKDNRRVTMAAPLMQPPSVGIKVRKSTRLNESPEPDSNVGIEFSRSPVKRESRTTTTTTKTHKIIKSAQDEFDTGSESESDIVNNYNSIKSTTSDFSRNSPATNFNTSSVRYSPPKSSETSYSSTRNLSFNTNTSPSRLPTYNSPSLASEYASDKLNQIRSRLSLNSPTYDSTVYSPSLPAKEETPFLSNFTKRLSALSNQKNDQDYKKEIKEHDTNGSSAFVRNQLSSFRAARGRDTTYDYKVNQNNILKNNFVSFAVLAGAALFFVVLAILYMGMRSDTSVIPADYIIPYCNMDDANFKKGVNCIFESDVSTALELLTAVKPELQKRAVANKCFDKTLKPHMTSSEIVNFCVSNYAIQNPMQIRDDLRNLEILIFNNPDWGISVAQTDNNNGLVSESDVAKDMEQVIFHENHKITSLVILKPDLPWKCTFYKTFYLVFNSILLVSFIFAALYLLNYGYKYYKHYEQKQRDEIGFMVEKIIDVLQSSCGEEGGEPFLVINHVRDMILPVVDRHKNGKTWAKAVQFINENESRVRTEIQEVKGEPFEVWRWIGSANISMGGERSDYRYRHGRRIVDAQYLINEVLKFPHKSFRFCTNSDVTIKNEVREGVLSVLVLQCQTCKREHSVCSEDPDSELMNVNLALVAGIVSLGLSLYQLNELCSSLHIPAISGDEYSQYLDEIYEIYNDSIADSTKSNASTFEKQVLRSSTPKSNASTFEKQVLRSSTPKSNASIFEKQVLRSLTPKRQAVENNYEEKKSAFLRDLKKSPEEIEKLSNMTINQRQSPLWYEERKKRLTASNFGRICKLLYSTDRKKVVQELLHSTFMGNIYTKYGNDNEINAIRDFERIFGKKVDSCGMFIHKEYPFLAASPDGLLGENAIVEIKCPYKARGVTPEDGIRQKLIQFASFENGIFSLKKTDKYYYQVQGQLFVTGREFCYFIVWTPHGMVYEKIARDGDLWNTMLPKMEDFYFTHLMPAILEER